MFSENHIILDLDAKSKEEVLHIISKKAVELKICEDEETLYKAFIERERESCTGMQKGVAIPHAKSEIVINPSLIFVSLKEPLVWESLDNEPIHLIFSLMAPTENGCFEHLKMLSCLATQLLDDSFIASVKEADNVKDMKTIIERAFI